MPKALIYEVALEIDGSVASDFDTWLSDHVRRMLDLPGFESAEILRDEPTEGRERRIVRYRLSDQQALDDYLATHAARMRQEAIDRFGDQFSATRRTLSLDRALLTDMPEDTPATCLNCGSSLSGQYCAVCGQRARVRLITVWELFRDLLGDLFELDSRLWRSLRPLLFRPGKLTVDYLGGRRAYYMPPFRMYLVLSLLFFLISVGGQDPAFNIQVDGSSDTDEVSLEISDGETSTEDPSAESPEPIVPSEQDSSEAQSEFERDLEEARQELEAEGINLQITSLEDCRSISEWSVGPFRDRLIRACEQIMKDHGQSLGKALIDNIPMMMFVFLPLVAVVLKLLYPLSGRYFVEHLLFLIHYHSFVFLILTINALFSRIPVLEAGTNILAMVAMIYIPLYLLIAMKRVYQQGWIATSLKYMLLVFAYFWTLLLSFVVTLVVTALTL